MRGGEWVQLLASFQVSSEKNVTSQVTSQRLRMWIIMAVMSVCITSSWREAILEMRFWFSLSWRKRMTSIKTSNKQIKAFTIQTNSLLKLKFLMALMTLQCAASEPDVFLHCICMVWKSYQSLLLEGCIKNSDNNTTHKKNTVTNTAVTFHNYFCIR